MNKTRINKSMRISKSIEINKEVDNSLLLQMHPNLYSIYAYDHWNCIKFLSAIELLPEQSLKSKFNVELLPEFWWNRTFLLCIFITQFAWHVKYHADLWKTKLHITCRSRIFLVTWLWLDVLNSDWVAVSVRQSCDHNRLKSGFIPELYLKPLYIPLGCWIRP